MNRDLLRALTAEAIGTFALVFAGCGAIMVDAQRLPSLVEELGEARPAEEIRACAARS